jgi:hypothetical protein
MIRAYYFVLKNRKSTSLVENWLDLNEIPYNSRRYKYETLFEIYCIDEQKSLFLLANACENISELTCDSFCRWLGRNTDENS